MKAEERRKEIINLLLVAKNPISGGELAERFNVSRQIIVQDIAQLKTLGYEIFSTHYGYIARPSLYIQKSFKLRHTKEQTEDELNTIVDLGGSIVEVFVWHKAYGKVSVNLNICTRKHVKQFIENVRTGKSSELMDITGGYHYHTVRTESEEVLNNIHNALKQKGYLVE